MSDFYDNLKMGIIKQAVDDYCHAVRRISELNDTDRVMLQMAALGAKRKEAKIYTVGEAKEEIRYKITLEEAVIKEVEAFFFSDWFKKICTLDYSYLLNETKQKAIDELIRIIVYKLQTINQKNAGSKQSKKVLEDYKTLKMFLESDYLHRFTKRSSESYIEEIKRRTSEFFVTKQRIL